MFGVACFMLGIFFQRFSDARKRVGPSQAEVTRPVPVAPTIDFATEPLWAYGFDTVAKPGDKAAPQAAPKPQGDRRLQEIRELRRNDPKSYDYNTALQNEELALIEASLPASSEPSSQSVTSPASAAE